MYSVLLNMFWRLQLRFNGVTLLRLKRGDASFDQYASAVFWSLFYLKHLTMLLWIQNVRVCVCVCTLVYAAGSVMYGNKRAFIFLRLTKIRIFSLRNTLVRCKALCLRCVSSVVVFVFGSDRVRHEWNTGAPPFRKLYLFWISEPVCSLGCAPRHPAG